MKGFDTPLTQVDPNLAAVVQGNTEFAFSLYEKLRTAEGNLFFSPHSISTALAMTYAGARGETEAQMAQALCFRLDQAQLHPAFARLEALLREIGSEGQVQLKVANSLWPRTGYALLEAFLALAEQFYGVSITPVDYHNAEAARATINGWAEARTEGKIQNLIPPGVLDPLTALVLVNAIYFKGDWALPFDSDRTRDEPFWTVPDAQVQVPMMHQTSEFGYADRDGLQVLELPYAGQDLSMVVLLPKERTGLAELEEHLTVENVGRWTGRLWPREVQVWLPRFGITWPFRLDAKLMSLGMVDAFGDADFSGMDGRFELYIGAVLHKAFVAVNEEGTEAAAATAVVMQERGMPPPPAVFRADHPFVFLIRDNRTGSILFLGRVTNPVAEEA